MGEEIIAGKRRSTLEAVGDLARSVNPRDDPAQKGQRVDADREHERLGRADRLVILLRSI